MYANVPLWGVFLRYIEGPPSRRSEKPPFAKEVARRSRDGGLYFVADEMCAANENCINLVYFIHFASQNTILSQPAADSSFAKGAFFRLGRDERFFYSTTFPLDMSSVL